MSVRVVTGSLGDLATEPIVVRRRSETLSRGAPEYAYSDGETYPAALKWFRPHEIQAFGRDAASVMVWFLTDDRPDPDGDGPPTIGDLVDYNGDSYEVVGKSRQINGLSESYWKTPCSGTD